MKTKKNRKLEAKFFGLFQVLHLVGKQAYKLELSQKWRIHDVFHMSLLEQDSIKKGRVDENPMKFDVGDNDSRKYKVEAIRDSVIYAQKLESYHLPEPHYLVFWKGCVEKKNTWKPYSAAQHLKKLISLFYRDYFDYPIATCEAIDTTPPMSRQTIKPTA